jgi:23S rRNA pseudouridine2605 synthase
MVRMLRDQAAYEAPLSDEDNPFLVSASVFPYFYSLVGERNPKQPPVLGPRSPYSPLACDAFELIRRRGPISKSKLGEMLGGSVSNAGLDRALGELWAKLRITRVDYTVEAGSVWDELSRWAPEVVREGVGISVPEALSALVSKYLDCAVAVDEGDVEKFLSSFVPRTRVKEAIHALLSARELSFVHVGSKSLLQVTPPKQAYVPKPRPVRVS